MSHLFCFVARFSKQDICAKCQKPRSNCLSFLLQGKLLPPFLLGSHYTFQSTGKKATAENARPDEGGYHRRKVVSKCALEKNGQPCVTALNDFVLPAERKAPFR